MIVLMVLLCWVVRSGLSSPLLDVGNEETLPTADIVGVTAAELENFQRYAQWAGASYCDPVADTSVYCRGDICPAGADKNARIYDVFYGTMTDILAFLAIAPATSELVLSVRGTSSLANWLDDVLWTRAPTTLCEGCAAHLGFLTAYGEIVGQVNASLTAAMALYPGYRITVTGHSLGGAVATLLALHFRDALRGVLPATAGGVALYTYGSPRVGNLALATYVTQQQSGRASGGNYRVTHAGDVVPRVPPAIEGFRHVSPEYWLASGPATRTAYEPAGVDECDGYASAGCDAGAPWWEVDVVGHLYYLVAISHCGENRTSFFSYEAGGGGGGGGGARAGGGIGRYGNGNGNGNGTGMGKGPVNGTTATNSSSNGTVGGLKPETVNTLAMYAKLDQEFMVALEEEQDGGVEAKLG